MRKVQQTKSKRSKEKAEEVVFDVKKQRELLEPPKRRAIGEKEKKRTEKSYIEKDFDRWLEKRKKQGNPHSEKSTNLSYLIYHSEREPWKERADSYLEATDQQREVTN